MVRDLLPLAPARDLDAIVEQAVASKGLRTARPANAAWLSAVAYVRHSYTDYDQMRDEGYDEPSARHFCLDGLNEVLRSWGARRLVSGEDQDSSA